ncbi:hypothetical protein TTHERM_000497679 (macronuclear) [Tetrahymena thermophila SB210]|uniref:Uncharacterized protein n=1 Tax=Tetrahymena thermophila (strain SB210) TaxID=312017 RepID=W7WVW0_TETTS|nr:hypothetical protein TTHERM_000497679 [Tetrahymena thermophila SB210]EWS70955.1 hypothetical protein TTHERM_000497679 [Tetrahymena thermophila SB210]|eukprot:XP_012656511.1 hypothetical protein TTHERM_000497679 [Tetrahymena thermophila SB210]
MNQINILKGISIKISPIIRILFKIKTNFLLNLFMRHTIQNQKKNFLLQIGKKQFKGLQNETLSNLKKRINEIFMGQRNYQSLILIDDKQTSSRLSKRQKLLLLYKTNNLQHELIKTKTYHSNLNQQHKSIYLLQFQSYYLFCLRILQIDTYFQ